MTQPPTGDVTFLFTDIGQSLTFARCGDEARPHLVEARERFAEMNVHPGVITGDTMLGLVARDDDPVVAARHWLAALTGPGRPWTEDEVIVIGTAALDAYLAAADHA